MRKSLHLAGLDRTDCVALKLYAGLCLVNKYLSTAAALAPISAAPLSLAAGSIDDELL